MISFTPRSCFVSLAASLVLALAPVAHAQSASFTPVINTLGSGFNNPNNVAVDARGDVFVSSNLSSTLEEIVATNGTVNSSSAVVQVGPVFPGNLGSVAAAQNGDVYVAVRGYGIQVIRAGTGGAAPGTVNANSTVQVIVNPSTIFGAAPSMMVDTDSNLWIGGSTGNIYEIMAGTGGAAPGAITSSSTINTINTIYNQTGGAGGPNVQIYGLARDAAGDLFIADSGYSGPGTPLAPLSELVATNGVVNNSSSIVSISTSFYPYGIAFDSSGNLFLNLNGRQLDEFIAGTGTAPAGTINSTSILSAIALVPGRNDSGLALDQFGNIYTADLSGYVHQFEPQAAQFGAQSLGATSPSLLVPFVNNSSSTLTFTGVDVVTQGATGKDFAQAASGTTCITTLASAATCVVAVTFTPQHPGQRIGSVVLTGSGATGSAPITGIGVAPQVTLSTVSGAAFIPSAINPVGSGFNTPYDVAIDSSGDVFVADTANNAVKEIVASGGVVGSASAVNTIGSGFSYPTGVAVDGQGDIFVADSNNNAVKEILASGGVVSSTSTVVTVGSGFNFPIGVTVDAFGDVFVSDAGNNAVKEILAGTGSDAGTGSVLPPGIVNSSSSVISVGSGFNFPIGVTVDTYGNVFVGDSGNNAVKEIRATSGGVSSTSSVVTVGSGFHQPFGVAVDGAGNVFVADSGNKSIKEIFAGTGGAAAGTVNSSSYVHPLGSGFINPSAVAVDPAGNLFAADQSLNLVSELTFATPPSSLTFAATDVGVSSAPQTVVLANNGNAPLTLPIPTIAGAENPSLASGFTYEDSSTCLQNGSSAASEFTVAAGSGCSMLIAFTPTTTGTTTGSLVLTNNNLNAASPTYATQTISLTGNSNLTLPATTTTLALGSTTIYPGNSLTLTATVKDASNNSISGASVIFYNGYTPIGSATTNSSGVATLITSSLHDIGTTNIMASFPGNSTEAASNSTQQQLSINFSPTTTVLSLSSSTINAGFPLTLTATVTDASNNPVTYGTVTFYYQTVEIGRAVITGSQAVLTTTALHDVGTTHLTAKYNGDYLDAASTSTSVPLTVNISSTTTALSLSSSTINAGASLTLTATVTDASNNPVTYGIVTFYYQSTQLGVGVISGGHATLTTTALHDVGTTHLSAKYNGDYLDTASTSAPVQLTINKIATTTQLSLSKTTLLASFPLTLTAIVTDASNNPITYGTVTFYNQTAEIGLAVITGGQAVLTTTALHDVGATHLTAKYNGDYRNAASTSTPVQLTIE